MFCLVEKLFWPPKTCVQPDFLILCVDPKGSGEGEDERGGVGAWSGRRVQVSRLVPDLTYVYVLQLRTRETSQHKGSPKTLPGFFIDGLAFGI